MVEANRGSDSARHISVSLSLRGAEVSAIRPDRSVLSPAHGWQDGAMAFALIIAVLALVLIVAAFLGSRR